MRLATKELVLGEVPRRLWEKQLELADERLVLFKEMLNALLDESMETRDNHKVRYVCKSIKFWEQLREEANEELKMSIEQTLKNRKEVYGEYDENVKAVAKIMKTLNKLHASAHGSLLSEKDRANLSYAVIKLVRLGVTPSHIDSWHDLGNYAHLAEDFYSKEQE